MSTTSTPKLLTTAEAAELVGIAAITLTVWRQRGTGPEFLKLGRVVRYKEAKILEWMDAQARTNTSQYPSECRNNQSNLTSA